MECQDDSYPKLKNYISELSLGTDEYKSVAFVKINCMI